MGATHLRLMRHTPAVSWLLVRHALFVLAGVYWLMVVPFPAMLAVYGMMVFKPTA